MGLLRKMSKEHPRRECGNIPEERKNKSFELLTRRLVSQVDKQRRGEGYGETVQHATPSGRGFHALLWGRSHAQRQDTMCRHSSVSQRASSARLRPNNRSEKKKKYIYTYLVQSTRWCLGLNTNKYLAFIFIPGDLSYVCRWKDKLVL